tara:strand:+ start:270 stop:617 length:348 start_codon:yes stop_codon:yes gene_type:complete
MIKGFEDYTEQLNEYEKNTLLPIIIRGLKTKIGVKNAITNKRIAEALSYAGYKGLHGSRIRKIINYIRIEGSIINLVASSKGYWIEDNIEIRKRYVEGVKSRANSMLASLNNIEI